MKKIEDNPLISVIIPTYNRSNTIQSSIESVLNQTYTNIEVIVIDDASSDDTEWIIQNIKDDRIKYFKNLENRGAHFSRNRGVSKAKGSLIAFQDSDDLWRKHKLKMQIQYINEGYDIVSSAMDRYRIGSKLSQKITNAGDQSMEVSPSDLFPGNFISTQTLLLRKAVLYDVQFDEKLPAVEDWDFIVRASEKWKVYFSNEALVESYIQENSLSNDQYKYLYMLYYLQKRYYQHFSSPEVKKKFKKYILTTHIKCIVNLFVKPKDIRKIKRWLGKG
jgi:teichuronic acid biosynthesis glycosyltransferase TuaG